MPRNGLEKPLNAVVSFFESIPDLYRTAVLVGGLAFFWVVEGALPRFPVRHDKLRHAGLNLLLASMVITVGLLLGFLLVRACDFTTANRFGLLYLLAVPLWLHVLLGLLTLDLIGAYAIHRIQRHVAWMWRFHVVHHSDTAVDVTTSLRQHPGETAFRIAFMALGILMAGIPVGVLILYQTLALVFAQLGHANISLPSSVDRVLSYVFVSPDMHKVHHHYRRPFTNMNYGNVFSIWDRLLGTYAEASECTPLRYGIDTHMDPAENADFKNLFQMPFRKERS